MINRVERAQQLRAEKSLPRDGKRFDLDKITNEEWENYLLIEKKAEQNWVDIFVAMGGNRKELQEEMEFQNKLTQLTRNKKPISEELIDKLVNDSKGAFDRIQSAKVFYKGYGVDLDDY